MAAMQQQAYLEDDDFHMDMNDEHDPAMQEFFRQIEVWKFFEKNGKKWKKNKPESIRPLRARQTFQYFKK